MKNTTIKQHIKSWRAEQQDNYRTVCGCGESDWNYVCDKFNTVYHCNKCGRTTWICLRTGGVSVIKKGLNWNQIKK